MAAEVLSLTPLDQMWMLLTGCLVFIMQAGFLCVEAGMSRAKHSMNVAVKNVTDYLVASIAFFGVGYGLMFGRSWGGLIGTTETLFTGALPPDPVFFFFQMVFCGTAATIVSGAMAERMKFSAYLVYSAFISLFLYPLFGHWVWGGAYHLGQQGWLEGLGYMDFAGSSVVHQMGGWVALAGICVLGPRLGKFDAAGNPRRIIGHNIPLALTGLFILWFGWFGFNGGSTYKMDETVGWVFVNTNLGGAAGALTALAVGWPMKKRPDIFDIANGALGGLVAITASAAYVTPLSALFIGAAAGGVVLLASEWLERGLKLDDAVGAVSVHGFCGAWGILAAGIFAQPQFLLHPEARLYHVGIQALGTAVCFLTAFGGGWIFFTLLHRTLGIRVSEEAEKMGLNLSEHQAASSIQELAASMRRISETKDWTMRAEMDPYSDAGELGEQFNRLIQTIERTMAQLQTKREALEANSQDTRQAKEELEKQARDMKRLNAELQSKMDKLESMNKIMMGREDRILELKEKVRQLSPGGEAAP